MSKMQRITSIVSAVLRLLVIPVLLIFPKEGYIIVALFVSMTLYIFGFRKLWFYFTMARHMVGGKSVLIEAIILIDLALFADSVVLLSPLAVIIYLLSIFAFTGVVELLRAREEKNCGSPAWKRKAIEGVITVLFALTLGGLAIFGGNTHILVIGYCISLFYSAAVRLVNAFSKTAIVYIQ